MEGKPVVIEALLKALKEEMGAISQYFLHAELCSNWGYERLAKITKARAITEMKHAEKLIERIIFLESVPDLSEIAPLHVGADVRSQLMNDLDAEKRADATYNEGILACREAGDNTTADLMKDNLLQENDHINFLESQLTIIEQAGLQDYLASQVRE